MKITKFLLNSEKLVGNFITCSIQVYSPISPLPTHSVLQDARKHMETDITHEATSVRVLGLEYKGINTHVKF